MFRNKNVFHRVDGFQSNFRYDIAPVVYEIGRPCQSFKRAPGWCRDTPATPRRRLTGARESKIVLFSACGIDEQRRAGRIRPVPNRKDAKQRLAQIRKPRHAENSASFPRVRIQNLVRGSTFGYKFLAKCRQPSDSMLEQDCTDRALVHPSACEWRPRHDSDYVAPPSIRLIGKSSAAAHPLLPRSMDNF